MRNNFKLFITISLTGERSIYSHEFGPWANFKDEDIQDDFFKCSCGKTKGKYNLGVICPEPGCNTPVKEMDYSIDKFGYFETPVKFLTYKGYQLLNRILSGNKKSDGILDLLCSVKLPKNIVDNKGKLKYKESDLALVKRYKNTYPENFEGAGIKLEITINNIKEVRKVLERLNKTVIDMEELVEIVKNGG
jgi:hypothetical protein